MKKYVTVWMSAAILILSVGTASAGTRVSLGGAYDDGQVPPGMDERGCEEVGSGIYDCEVDIECWEDDAKMMSVCRKFAYNKPEHQENL